IALLAPQGASHAGWALPITRVRVDLNAWHGSAGIRYPLAPLPDSLTFRGTSAVVTGGNGVAVQSIQPTRGSRGQDLVVTINGSGFVAGAATAVRFVPGPSQTGGFPAAAGRLGGNSSAAQVP